MKIDVLAMSYRFVDRVIYAEFALVVLLVVLAFVLSGVRVLILWRKHKIKMSIEKYLIRMNNQGLLFDPDEFHFHWEKLDILLEVVKMMDARCSNEHWLSIRSVFIQDIVFPLAIDFSTSCDWKKRLLAVEAFGLLRDRENHVYIENLVNDSIPLVAIYAGRVALLNHSEEAIDSLIKRIGHERWGAQLIDLHSFNVYPPEAKSYFLRRLNAATEPRIRAALYKILSRYQPGKITWDILPDVFSTDDELKISSLKFLTLEDRAMAIPLLIDTLKAKNLNRVRLIVLHCLNVLKAPEAIPALVACLSDENWWIKVSAAEALQNIGPEGVLALKREGIDIDAVSYNTNHTFNTWW